MEIMKAEDLVADILDNLHSRKGFDEFWDGIDAMDKDDLFEELVAIARLY